jgi:hypothetical protein
MEDRSLTVAAPIRATTVREWFPAKEKHYAVRAVLASAWSGGADLSKDDFAGA